MTQPSLTAPPRPRTGLAALFALTSIFLAAAVIVAAILAVIFRFQIADSVSDHALATLAIAGLVFALLLIIIGLLTAVAAAARGKLSGRNLITAAGLFAFLANGFALLLLFCVALFLRSTTHTYIDRSLTDADYRAAGLPSPASRWTPDDYNTATDALKKIAADHPECLPRWNSRHSSTTFDRMASLDNITSADTIEARIGVLASLAAAVDSLRNLYVTASDTQHPYADEFVELSNLLLKISVPLKTNMQAYVDAIRDDTSRRQQAAAKLATVQSSLADFAEQWIDRMCDATLNANQITRMARYARDGLPELMKAVPADDARRDIARLAATAAAATDTDERAAINSLLAALPNAP